MVQLDSIDKQILGGNSITKYNNFISLEECNELINFFNAAYSDWNQICFYESYGMHIKEPLKVNHKTKISEQYLEELRQKMIQYVSDAAGRPMKINSMHAQKWEVGAFARDHSDNSDLEGNDSGWRDNKWFSGLYLNENYSGGILTFRDHDISLKLESGTFLAFPGGVENIHGVTEVTEGTRYTICVFWDYADSWYNEEELQEMESLIFKERILQDKLKSKWKDKILEPFENDAEGTRKFLGSDPYEMTDDVDLSNVQLKSNARRNQENAIKEGTVPEGIVVDLIIKE
jgi:predicted 2-oxoglutarate/Fe(II)-dependent dioxygenase YbiX